MKLYAKAFNFLQDKNITPLLQLQEVVSEMKKRSRNTNGEIKQTELTLYQTAERYLKEHLGKQCAEAESMENRGFRLVRKETPLV